MGLKSRKERTEQTTQPETPVGKGTQPLRADLRFEFINDYFLSDELRALKETAREFGERELNALVPDPRDTFIPQEKLLAALQNGASKEELEKLVNAAPRKVKRSRAQEFVGREGRFPMELWDKIASLGFFGIPFPEQYGGLGLGEMGNVAMFEELGKYDSEVAASIGLQLGLWEMPLFLDGTEDQRQQYLVPSIQGKMRGAFCLTEPGHGSDATNLETRAVEKNGYFHLTGTKQFITSATYADYFIVFGVTDPELQPGRGTSALIVPANAPGVTLGPHEDKMGIRASETASVRFDDVKVPVDSILGGNERRGKGLFSAMLAIDISRLTLAAGALGGSVAAIDKTLAFAAQREVAGGLLITKDNFQQDIGRCVAETYNMATTVYCIAKSVDDWIERGRPMQGYRSPFTVLAAVAKSLAPVKAREVITNAIIYHGGYGFIEDYDIAKMYRDEIISELFEGTTFTCQKEIMKWVRDAGEYNLH